jgi:hypothetical protein
MLEFLVKHKGFSGSAYGTICRSSGPHMRNSEAGQTLDQPPSDAITWPLTHPASSLTSQATRRAASSGAPQRPPGSREATALRISSVA